VNVSTKCQEKSGFGLPNIHIEGLSIDVMEREIADTCSVSLVLGLDTFARCPKIKM
jgi:hypothetical protein